MHEEKYSETELEEIQEDFDRLTTMWNLYIERGRNSSKAEAIHPPPAVVAFSRMLHQATPFFDHTFGDLPIKLGTAIEQSLIGYANEIFQFAQLCSANGVLHANMTPCNCGQVTDDDLKRLLGEDS